MKRTRYIAAAILLGAAGLVGARCRLSRPPSPSRS